MTTMSRDPGDLPIPWFGVAAPGREPVRLLSESKIGVNRLDEILKVIRHCQLYLGRSV